MTRFVVDAGAVLHIIEKGIEVSPGHELLAPTLLRSQVLSLLHEAVHRGEITAEVGRERLARIGQIKMRLLGDAVLRKVAWEMADRLGWATTYDAEYLALTRLQADAFVTLDSRRAQQAKEVVSVATIDDLGRPPKPGRDEAQ